MSAVTHHLTICVVIFNQMIQHFISRFLLSDKLHPQTISCVATRARPFGISIEIVDVNSVDFSAKDIGGIIFQYPDTEGSINDFSDVINRAS